MNMRLKFHSQNHTLCNIQPYALDLKVTKLLGKYSFEFELWGRKDEEEKCTSTLQKTILLVRLYSSKSIGLL